MFFSHADRRFYLRQAIRIVNLGSGSVQRELANLTRAGILKRTDEGSQAYFQANRQCVVFDELHGLIRKTFGVASVLQDSLSSLAHRIRVAFIYGSVAAGTETSESDVDVMVVGDEVSIDKIVSALTPAQLELGREVNPSVYGTAEFCRKLAQGRHFLSNVTRGPKIFLIGDETELKRLAQERMAQSAQAKLPRSGRPLRRRGS
jgi:predicted nucleotidyltransferase